MGLIDKIGTVEDVAADYDDMKVLRVGPRRSPFSQGLAGIVQGTLGWMTGTDNGFSGGLQMVSPVATSLR
jgi:hypothetical protein